MNQRFFRNIKILHSIIIKLIERVFTFQSLLNFKLPMTNDFPGSRNFLSILTVFSVLMLQGCVSTERPRTHVSLDQGSARMYAGSQLVIAPVDAKMYEITVSGALEERPDWSEQSETIIKGVAKETLQELFQIDTVFFPTLSESEKKVLDEHIALYRLLSQSKDSSIHLSTDWNERFYEQDMCLGAGLAFLSHKSDAEIMIFFTGQQARSTSGRVAMLILAAAMGVAMPTGQSYLEVAAIDLRTGNVLWRDAAISPTFDLKQQSGANRMMKITLRKFGELADKIQVPD